MIQQNLLRPTYSKLKWGEIHGVIFQKEIRYYISDDERLNWEFYETIILEREFSHNSLTWKVASIGKIAKKIKHHPFMRNEIRFWAFFFMFPSNLDITINDCFPSGKIVDIFLPSMCLGMMTSFTPSKYLNKSWFPVKKFNFSCSFFE